MKGRPLWEGEFLQAAVLGWAVEFVCLSLERSQTSKSTYFPCPASGVLPCPRRSHGQVYYAPGSALLLSPPGRGHNLGKRRDPPRVRHISAPEAAFPRKDLLCRPIGIIPRGIYRVSSNPAFELMGVADNISDQHGPTIGSYYCARRCCGPLQDLA